MAGVIQVMCILILFLILASIKLEYLILFSFTNQLYKMTFKIPKREEKFLIKQKHMLFNTDEVGNL